MNNITKTAIGCASLILTLTGCSQQQVSGDSSQVAGSSQQVAGSSQQVAGSSQQVSPEQITKECPECNAPKVEPVATTAKPTPPAPAKVSHANRWTHTHPAIPRCTNSITHTHKYKNRNHHHKYSCQKPRSSSSINIGALQRKLKAKGLYKGPINGVINAETRDALKRYQQRRHNK